MTRSKKRGPRDRDLEHRMHLLHDAVPVLLAYVDRDLVYRSCNARYEDWFGLRREDVVGRPLREVIGDAAFAQVLPWAERVLRGERVSFEQVLPYCHGPARYVRVEYIPDVLEDGEVLGYFAMILDETERETNERLRSLLAGIVENSNDAILGKDLEGNVTAWNAAAERMYGYTAAEMLGQPLARVVPPGRESEVLDVIERLRAGEELVDLQTLRRTKDGREIHVSVRASPIRDRSGALVGVSTIVRDETVRQLREQALRESELRLKIAQEAAELGIHDFDVRSGTIRWDACLYDLWGITHGEPITYGSFLSGVHPDDREATHAAIEAALDPDGDGYFRHEYRIVQRGSRRVLWVEATGLVTFEGREPVRLVGTARDVTERRRILEALEEADRRKDRFLATLGHELRSPLGALVHAIQSLKEGLEEEPRERLYALMARQAEQMTHLLNDLLDIGRITRGDVKLRPRRLRLCELVERAIETLQSELATLGHEVVVDIEPPELELVADPVRLEQVLINLLSNAARYTKVASAIRVVGREKLDWVQISVVDSGVGLSADEQQRIFEFFYQSTKGSGGLGIGLSLVRSLVELHQGSVVAQSDGPGTGTTIRIELPRSLRGSEVEPSKAHGGTPEFADLAVLLVEDHVDSLHALEFLLAPRCTFRAATTGTAALDALEQFRPDVLIVDLALPDMTGLEFVEAARERLGEPEPACFATTGFGDDETAEQLRDAGFDAHLVKPVSPAELCALLGRVQGAKERSSRGRSSA